MRWWVYPQLGLFMVPSDEGMINNMQGSMYNACCAGECQEWLLTHVNSIEPAAIGYVPLFVEHCEAVAAEVDVTRRWLGRQEQRGLSHF